MCVKDGECDLSLQIKGIVGGYEIRHCLKFKVDASRYNHPALHTTAYLLPLLWPKEGTLLN